MPRPRLYRKIFFDPRITFYKPQGVPLRNLEIVNLTLEECESLRLKNVEEFDQTKAAKKMGTSQSTFQRVLSSAQKKVSTAIVNGMAIKILQK